DSPALPRLVHPLTPGRPPERGDPPAPPGPPRRRLLHDRGAAHLRPLPLPGPAERRHEGEPPHPRQAAPPAGRGSLVERGLYRRAQGPRANTFRIGRPPPEPSTQAPEPNPSSSRTTPKFHARSRTARPIQLAIV